MTRRSNPSRAARLGALLAGACLLVACSGGGNDATALVASAKIYVEKRDYAAAIIELKSALQKAPDDREARLLLGRSLLQTGDPTAAAIELQKALDLGADPNDVQPLLAQAVLGQGDMRKVVMQFAEIRLDRSAASADVKAIVATAHAALGERERALEVTLSALNDSPQHIPATLLHARLKAADGDTSGAIALVDQVLSGSSQNLNALLFKAELQRYGQRDVAAAQASYEAALAAHPKAVAAHAGIITLLLEQRDTAAARAQFARLKAAQPEHPETMLFDAQFAYLDGNFARTRELLEPLLRAFPNDMRVVQLAGVTELRLNSLSQAEAHLGRVVKAQPNERLPRQLLARIYNRTGQPGKAMEVLRPIVDSTHADSTSLTLAGEALLQTGDLARAEAAFARATKVNPQATTARAALALGQVARGNTAAGFAELEAAAAADTGIRSNMALIAARLRSKDIPGALKAIDALEKKQPDSPVAHTLRGSALMQKRDMAAATASFEKALQIDPQFYAATAGLASIELAAGRPEGAQKRFEDLLKLDPKNTRALLGLAELKARTGGTKEEVTAAITQAVKANPGEAGPRVLLVNHLLGLGDAKAALAAAQEASAALPNSVEVMEVLGMAQLAAGQGRQAVTTFSQLAALRPDRPEPQLRLAEAHLAVKDLKEARRALDKALEIRPGLLPAQRALAQLAMREDNPQEALRIARDMQTAQPKQAAGFALEADIELARNRSEAAIEPLRKALQVGGGTETAIKLHTALNAAMQPTEAERMAASWVKEHPRDAAFRYYLGDIALARKDHAAAEAHYRSVLEVQPNNALAMNNLAWMLAQQKRPGALPLAEKANELLPNRVPLMDTLAYVLALEKQPERAVALQRKAMAQNPEDPSLRLTLAKIHVVNGDRTQAKAELDTLAKLGDKFGAQDEVARLMATL
ncbi:MAG: PEP-CTERM system TPR-repeat protein PrsT [Betaproteobacteria bacterium]|nr:PEP-CTERM system TPR-repeat protein PrsT [Betaproteobacteria bacterium]